MKKIRVPGAGGSFELIDEPVRESDAGVRKRQSSAFGVCHSDSMTKEGGWVGPLRTGDFFSLDAVHRRCNNPLIIAN